MKEQRIKRDHISIFIIRMVLKSC